jgi:integrase
MKRGPYKATAATGSFSALIAAFRQSPRYLKWAPTTRARRDHVLGDFNAENGRVMVAELRRGDVIAMRDSMAATPDAANNWLKVIRLLLAYAVDLEIVSSNVAAGVPRLAPSHPDGFRTWRDDEIETFRAHWPIGSLPHTVLTLVLCTGAARVDLVALGWHSIDADRIRYRRHKTEVLVDLPILPELADVLETIPRDRMTFLETRNCTLRSDKGLTGDMARWVREAGLGAPDRYGRGLTLHGLRKALGRRLAEAGCSPHMVMAALGHESIASAQVYTKAYDRARAADSGFEMLAAPKEAKVVRLARKTNKP